MRIDTNSREFAAGLQVGDVVFTRVRARPFQEVSAATASWTNHVGIVVGRSRTEPLVAESTFPLSRINPFSRFANRSEHGRIAVCRPQVSLTPTQQIRLVEAARRRIGIWYDTGFNLHSRRQFCSRFVREILSEAADISVGDVESFRALLARQPGAALGFWHLWFFGRIPWKRETVTPASLLRSPALHLVFDGVLLPESTSSVRCDGAQA